jgi:hypothetical protein
MFFHVAKRNILIEIQSLTCPPTFLDISEKGRQVRDWILIRLRKTVQELYSVLMYFAVEKNKK